MPKFDEMNETDVREMIVRPLLRDLGYEHGTENNIRTEQTFRYAKTFLGRKKPNKDPDIVGRADYILDVIGVGRWVVEVKAPSEDITQDVVEQAFTYAAHPEVAALFFLVTNGRTFQLYRTSSLTAPLMAWTWDETEEVLLALANLVGPEAIRRKTKLLEPDTGKPLAKNVSSSVRIIGGHIRYEDHTSNCPALDIDMINGLELPVTGESVKRLADGRIHAIVNTAKSAPLLGNLSDLVGREDKYDFYTSDEYISTDPERPTIFQNLYQTSTPAGTPVSIPGMGKIPLMFSFQMTATTEAVGYVDGDLFKGTMQLSYEFRFSGMHPMVKTALEQQLGRFPETPTARGGGMFEVKLLNL